MQEAAEKGGFHLFSLTNCVHGLQKRHAGFTFRRVFPEAPTKKPLRPRLHELADHYNAGLTRQEISTKMGIAVSSVDKYRSWASSMGLIDESKTGHQNRQPEKRLRVAELHHQGLTNSEIASEMAISVNTVKTHKAHARANNLIRD